MRMLGESESVCEQLVGYLALNNQALRPKKRRRGSGTKPDSSVTGMETGGAVGKDDRGSPTTATAATLAVPAPR